MAFGWIAGVDAMKRVVRLEDREGALDFQLEGNSVRAALGWNGDDVTQHKLQCLEVEPGVYSLIDNDRSYEARVLRFAKGWVVEIAGRRFQVDVQDPREAGVRRKNAGAEGRQEITSPMPGKVVRVLVEEGATVEEGQGLIVVEAMKMQNEMKAPRNGKVVVLAARAGASVTAGEVLVTLE